VVEGTFQGKDLKQEFPCEVTADGELAPRAWGEVAVASLLSLNDPWTEGLVTAYCQQFNIASRAGSFLVLENDSDYKRFDIDKEKDQGTVKDVGEFLSQAWEQLGKEHSRKKALGRLLYLIDPRTKVLTGPQGKHVSELLGLLSEEDCNLPVAPLEGAIRKEKDAPAAYLAGLKKDRRALKHYIDEAHRRKNDKDADGAVVALSGILEEHAGRGDALRLVGYRLLDMDYPAQAAGLFALVLRQRPYEPHSFRDLARALEDAGQFPLAALLNEAVLSARWHERFHESVAAVTREEYSRLLRTALKQGKLSSKHKAYFEKRLRGLGDTPKAALRVSITWNTDNTDVDLHVIEPDGTKVFYSAPNSKNGGTLSMDLTEGYGPERYHTRTALKGEYKILVHYFRGNPNLLWGETHVSVTITRDAGTPKERTERHTVILQRQGDSAEVAKLKF
jgi:hypothetical protein